MELLIGDYESKIEGLINGIESFSKEFPNKIYQLYGTGEDGEKYKFTIINGKSISYEAIITWQERGLSTSNMDREDIVNELLDNHFDLIDTIEIAMSETTELRELLHNLRNKSN